nr:putative ribonuclease H-like domain-containing protein [Tanacetum cinerariifolium]
MKTHQLGPDFVMKKKACFNCGDFNHLAYDCRKRVRKIFTPNPVAHRPYRPSQRPVKINMNGARPNKTSFNKQAHSYANRPFHKTTAVRSPHRALWVLTVNMNFPPVNRKFSPDTRNFPTANRKFPTASRKFPTSSTKCSTANIGIKGKAVKPSVCWFWKPSQNLSNEGPKNNNGSSQNNIDDKGYWDSGCSRHMTGNISYVSDFKPFDGGYVSFGQRGCKITGKWTIKIGTKDAASQEVKKNVSSLRYITLPNWAHDALLEFSLSKPPDHYNTEVSEGSGNPNPTASTSNPPADQMETLTTHFKKVANQVETPSLDNILSLTNRFEDILRVATNSDESNVVAADISDMETAITASPTPTLRIHKDHPKSQIIGLMDTPIQTRNKSKEVEEQNPSWVEAMQEELLQFKIQNVWTLVDGPKELRPIGIKWVLKNKKDERRIVIRNKSRLVAQGHTQEERIDYDEVFAPVASIEAIRLFLSYASFMGFTVYQMDVKSSFLYGTTDEEVYVMQPPGFQDPKSPAKVYKVEKAMYGLHQAPRAWYGTLSKYLLKNGFQRVKRIFRYLKGHPKLGLWYPKESPFDLVAYSDSDYGGAIQDHKSTTGGCQFLGTSKNWGVLRILMISLRLIPLSEHNADFHLMVDFIEASHLMYALTVKPTVYVSHIRQFWSTARIETTDKGTQILATVDGIHRTVSESSLRRNLKLQDEEGISS